MNWIQLQAILWLRWRLSRNQMSRRGTMQAVLSAVILIGGMLGALGSAAGGFLAGARALEGASPAVVLLVWDGVLGAFLFFWVFGVITEIQRSETLDIARLLHLPVSLRQVFTINFLASHLTLSVVLMVPGMLGLGAGLAVSRGPGFLLLLPLALAGVFMISAWTYCVRGWLVALMVNQRRRRAIIVGITFGFVLLAQLPNLYLNLLLPARGGPGRVAAPASPQELDRNSTVPRPQELPAAFLATHKFVPPLWVSYGAISLARGDAGPALLGLAGALLLGGAGLRRAYRATVRFHRGEQRRSAAAPPSSPSSLQAPVRRNWLELSLPGVPAEAAPLALASFRSMGRAPEVKMALLTPFFMLVIFAMMLLGRQSTPLPELARPFLVTGAVVFSLFGMMQLMFNQFGFDRDAFRALLLLPAQRRNYLLGKNLSLLPVVLLGGTLFLVVLKVVARIEAGAMLAGMLQLIAAFLLLSMAGNLVSVLVPYRIAAGSLKPTKMPLKTTLMIFVSHLLFPVVLLPLFLPPLGEVLLVHWAGWVLLPVNVLLSAVLAGTAAWCYWISLESLGALLQRRERAILQTVTLEVE